MRLMRSKVKLIIIVSTVLIGRSQSDQANKSWGFIICNRFNLLVIKPLKEIEKLGIRNWQIKMKLVHLH